MKYNLNELIRVVEGLKPAAYSAAESLSAAAIDTKGFEEALVVLHAGTAAASAEADVTVRSGATTTVADHTAITGAAFAQITTANDETVYVGRINVRNLANRYVSIRNAGDGTNAVTLGVTVVLLPKHKFPASQVNAVVFSV